MINIYKQTWRGPRLVGWVDGRGNSYKNDWGPEGRLIDWSIDGAGRVYARFDGMRSLLGWVATDGTVYDKYAEPAGGVGGRTGIFVPTRFLPGVVFKADAGGAIYGRKLFATRLIGRVEGTSDLRHIGALALVYLR